MPLLLNTYSQIDQSHNEHKRKCFSRARQPKSCAPNTQNLRIPSLSLSYSAGPAANPCRACDASASASLVDGMVVIAGIRVHGGRCALLLSTVCCDVCHVARWKRTPSRRAQLQQATSRQAFGRRCFAERRCGIYVDVVGRRYCRVGWRGTRQNVGGIPKKHFRH